MQLFVGKKNVRQRKVVARYNIKRDKHARSRMPPLQIGDKVFLANGRLKKSEYKSRLDKATTGKKEYFNTSRVFTVLKRIKYAPDYYWYTLKEYPHERFYRDELYKI